MNLTQLTWRTGIKAEPLIRSCLYSPKANFWTKTSRILCTKLNTTSSSTKNVYKHFHIYNPIKQHTRFYAKPPHRVLTELTELEVLEHEARKDFTMTVPNTPKSYADHLTATKFFTSKETFTTDHGDSLPEVTVAYETWGKMNEDRSNVILLHCGLSSNAHAKSSGEHQTLGWWEDFIGPGLTLDTNKFFIVCCNVLGSCFGSTGPSSINPETGSAYGSSFPLITIDDMIKAQFLLMDHLGIDKVHASVGSSMGGMQSLAAAALYPKRVNKVVSISACCQSVPSSIAIRYAQRRCIITDPRWKGGNYYDGEYPFFGMRNARVLGTISYRSGPEWDLRFANRRVVEEKKPTPFSADFEIEEYLDFKAHQFCYTYDPNSMIYISKAMDLFDMGKGFKSIVNGMERVKCPTLVIGVQSDLLFPVTQQKDIVKYLRGSRNNRVTYVELDALFGHDTFLLDVVNVGTAVRGHIEF